MTKIHVEINFKKGPSFSTEVYTDDPLIAKSRALSAAKSWGFKDQVKNYKIKLTNTE